MPIVSGVKQMAVAYLIPEWSNTGGILTISFGMEEMLLRNSRKPCYGSITITYEVKQMAVAYLIPEGWVMAVS